jgi:hypothetical protein
MRAYGNRLAVSETDCIWRDVKNLMAETVRATKNITILESLFGGYLV